MLTARQRATAPRRATSRPAERNRAGAIALCATGGDQQHTDGARAYHGPRARDDRPQQAAAVALDGGAGCGGLRHAGPNGTDRQPIRWIRTQDAPIVEHWVDRLSGRIPAKSIRRVGPRSSPPRNRSLLAGVRAESRHVDCSPASIITLDTCAQRDQSALDHVSQASAPNTKPLAAILIVRQRTPHLLPKRWRMIVNF